jgi:hypothetical protein
VREELPAEEARSICDAVCQGAVEAGEAVGVVGTVETVGDSARARFTDAACTREEDRDAKEADGFAECQIELAVDAAGQGSRTGPAVVADQIVPSLANQAGCPVASKAVSNKRATGKTGRTFQVEAVLASRAFRVIGACAALWQAGQAGRRHRQRVGTRLARLEAKRGIYRSEWLCVASKVWQIAALNGYGSSSRVEQLLPKLLRGDDSSYSKRCNSNQTVFLKPLRSILVV